MSHLPFTMSGRRPKASSSLEEEEQYTPLNNIETASQYAILQEAGGKSYPATRKEKERKEEDCHDDAVKISNDKSKIETITISKTTPSTPKMNNSQSPTKKDATITTSRKKRKRITTTNGKNNKNQQSHTKKVVRFSPKKKNTEYIADDYDRTPPAIDVFDCDGCSRKILGVRYHCKQCDDFDLCKECAVGSTKISHIHSDYEIIVDDEDEDEDDLSD